MTPENFEARARAINVKYGEWDDFDCKSAKKLEEQITTALREAYELGKSAQGFPSEDEFIRWWQQRCTEVDTAKYGSELIPVAEPDRIYAFFRDNLRAQAKPVVSEKHGIKIRVDPTMPENEVRLETESDSVTVKNIEASKPKDKGLWVKEYGCYYGSAEFYKKSKEAKQECINRAQAKPVKELELGDIVSFDDIFNFKESFKLRYPNLDPIELAYDIVDATLDFIRAKIKERLGGGK